MKRFIPILFIFIQSVPNLIAQNDETQFYGTLGVSFFEEDVETLVGRGTGLHLGAGFQITDLIGIEFAIDTAPAFDNENLFVEELEKEFGTLFEYEYVIQPNFYATLMGTLTFKLEDDFSTIIKGGLASYEVEIEELLFESRYYFRRDSNPIIEDGSDAVFSVGVLYHRNEKQDFEFSITQVFGDAEALSLNCYWRYKFQ